MCNLSNLTGIGNVIALELLGSVDQSEWSMKTLSLAKHTWVALKNTKLTSLAKKYFSIPPEKLFYYPNIPSNIQEMIEEDEDDAPELLPAQSIARKKQEKRKIWMLISIQLEHANLGDRSKHYHYKWDVKQAILNFFKDMITNDFDK